MTTPLPIPGIIRRVRRDADLSQRDLAALLGVDQSLVARWETGELCPAVALLERVLAMGGFRLAVVSVAPEQEQPAGSGTAERSAAAEASPMRADAVRDRQRRRFPSHLDVHDRQDPMTGSRRPHAPWRRRRDRTRAATGVVPVDHPTQSELFQARAQGVRERRKALAQRVRGLPEWTPFVQSDSCSCPTACWLEARCDDRCPCGCEAAPGARVLVVPSGANGDRRATLGLL